MNLYLLRHGEAESYANSDESRALTDKGRKDVSNVAQQFVARALPIDRCFASPFLRAQQTAGLFVPHLSSHLPKQVEIEIEPRLTPDVRAFLVVQFLESIDAENILLVSHNPLLSELLALLNQGGVENMKIVGTSELYSISLDIVAPGMGSEQFCLHP